jgi:hypothetical protein
MIGLNSSAINLNSAKINLNPKNGIYIFEIILDISVIIK